MKYTYSETAGMIDHALLHPTMTDAELRAGCELAVRYGVASVCIKPLRGENRRGASARDKRRRGHGHRLPSRQQRH